MTKRVAILQSNYIPWKGYFDLIAAVDEFILFDDVQYTRRDWRNRNRIKTQDGVKWLTIPVEAKGKYLQTIRETRISDPSWARKHWSALSHSYARTPYFHEYADRLEPLYLDAPPESLSEVNAAFIQTICAALSIETAITSSDRYQLIDGKTERLVGLCKQAGATHYLSGPAARDYIAPELFEEADVELEYMDYSGYPEYSQPYPPFDHYVTVLDLLFCTGPDARKYMKEPSR